MNFGFLIFDGIEELDLFGPWEMVALWGRYLQGPECRFTVAASSAPVSCNMGTRLLPDRTLDDCPPLDFLLIPGGDGSQAAARDARLLHFIQQQAPTCRALLSVCTGSFVLQAAGLLDGQQATTHWGALQQLRQLPGVTVSEQRVVRSGKVWTAAGVSSGIDMTLAFIAEQAGEDLAGQVQLFAEYYPSERRYGQAHLGPNAPAYLAADVTQKSRDLSA